MQFLNKKTCTLVQVAQMLYICTFAHLFKKKTEPLPFFIINLVCVCVRLPTNRQPSLHIADFNLTYPNLINTTKIRYD